METILIVEDKESMVQMLEQALKLEGYEVIIAKDGFEGIKRIKDSRVDVVLTDLKLPKRDGLEVLKASKEENPLIPVIVMTAYATIEYAVGAMKLGAYDFITKPFDIDHLLLLIKRSISNQRLLTENILLKDKLSGQVGMPTIIGKSPGMIDVAENIKRVAPTKTAVLLLGESGTGKELFARAIHYLSPRKDAPFVPINCTAIPRELLESELFGHEKGAFTGANERKLGKFELANNGTIFLDEIGEMDMALQSKLLRALQESEIERVGGTKPIKVDVRIITASNRNLQDAVTNNRFRDDLYYRISVFPILIPPLRERKEDIPLLVEHFISRFNREMNMKKKGVTEDALKVLMDYDWKGNVRELENVIERAMILSDRELITSKEINLPPTKPSITDIPLNGTLDEVAKMALRIAESRRIRKALEDTGGNKSRAAEELNVSYKTLLNKIKEYGIED